MDLSGTLLNWMNSTNGKSNFMCLTYFTIFLRYEKTLFGHKKVKYDAHVHDKIVEKIVKKLTKLCKPVDSQDWTANTDVVTILPKSPSLFIGFTRPRHIPS